LEGIDAAVATTAPSFKLFSLCFIIDSLDMNVRISLTAEPESNLLSDSVVEVTVYVCKSSNRTCGRGARIVEVVKLCVVLVAPSLLVSGSSRHSIRSLAPDIYSETL